MNSLIFPNANSDPETVLVLAPHTDDGEFGCGATIAKLAARGHRVVYVAFSAAEKSVPAGMPPDTLRKEVRLATKVIGIAPQDCVVLDFEVRDFPLHRQQILDAMIGFMHEYKPSVVFLPSPRDTHQDHKTIAEEAFRAFKRTTMLGYEIPWNNLEFATRCFVQISEAQLELKVKSLECYRSQQSRKYCDAEYIRALATTRGMQINQRYAEVFDVIRLILR